MMAKTSILTAEDLRELLHYDPETGKFRWLVRKKGRKLRVLDNAGYIRPDGYRMIGIDRKYRYAQILAWLWMTGEWPPRLVDHINQNPSDNRWINLRLATVVQNGINAKPNVNNTSGFRGIYWHKVIARNGKDISRWCARFGKIHIGHFRTKTEAYEAYKRFVLYHHGDFLPKHSGETRRMDC